MSKFYLFRMTNGKKKLAYGTSVEEALEILSYRLSPDEMATIIVDEEPEQIRQAELADHVSELG